MSSCSPTLSHTPTLSTISESPFGPAQARNSIAAKWKRKLANRRARKSSDTAIVDSGASSIYVTPTAPTEQLDPSAPKVRVGTASGQPLVSSADCKLALPAIPDDMPSTGHVMPGFQHNLLGIAPFCDKDCNVLFTKHSVTIYDPTNKPMLSGWREIDGHGNSKLWRISLVPEDDDVPCVTPDLDVQEAPLDAFSAYDLPSVEALVKYFHAAAGFPVRDTWLKAIKAGNFSSWPGLTYKNAAKYCPSATETLKGHMAQPRQNVRSTKPKQRSKHFSTPIVVDEPLESDPLPDPNELHIRVHHVASKLYTDDCGKFPVRSRGGNNYIMIAYHSQSNMILSAPFKSRADRHRLQAYNSIMQRLKDKNLMVDLQILDNAASKEYKRTITEEWGVKFQLVPPHIHRRNTAERAIRTFKAHFLSVLAGVSGSFPKYLWDLLLPQTELTLNLLRQANLDPTKSAWEFFNGTFNYDATPLGPLGIDVLIHKKSTTRNSWDFRSKEGWNVGVALDHYRCQIVVAKDTKAAQVSDAVEFRHQHLTQPTLTPADRVLHGINTLSCALEKTPAVICDAQLNAITALRDICTSWAQTLPASGQDTCVPDQPRRSMRLPRDIHSLRVDTPVPRVDVKSPLPRVAERPAPRVEQAAVQSEPIARRTRSQINTHVPPVAAEPIAHRTRSHSANTAVSLDPIADMFNLPEF